MAARAGTIRVDGVRETIAALTAIRGKALADRQVGDLFVKAAAIVAGEARNRAPRGETGGLKEAIVSKAGKANRLGPSALAAVEHERLHKRDSKGNVIRYPYIVEQGAPPHIIRPKKGVLRVGGRGFARAVNHPGFRGVGYFRKAWNATKGRVIGFIESGLRALVRIGATTGYR